MRNTRTVLILAAASAVLFLAPMAQAQKPGTKFREFPAYGFKFKPLAGWLDVPVAPEEAGAGIIGQLDAERPLLVKVEGGDRPYFTPSLVVLKIDPPSAATESGGSDGGLRGGVDREKGKEDGAKDLVERLYGGSLRKAEFAEVVPERQEVKILKELTAINELITTYMVSSNGVGLDIVYDCWMFPLSDFKIFFIWDYPASMRKDWQKAVEKSMKSLRLGDAVEGEVERLDDESSYEDFKAFHEAEVAQTPGWRIAETPSKQFLIKTNEPDQKKINEVIKRLEAARKVFEDDFPPATPMTAVSVVRICATEEEFHKYGKTGGGVAGWFNPGTTELVLYFNPDAGPDFVLEVMTHEGFHQYCHFLFGETEAHRWYDEGHGDYYGGFDLKNGKLVVDAHMSSGLKRITEIKDMIKEGTYKPVSAHLRYNHGEWQTQGPSNVSCYAQSWSIIYFLRQGMRGKGGKQWKKEYADILPHYVEHLQAGYAEAKKAIVDEAQAELEKAGASIDPTYKQILEETIKHPENRIERQVQAEIWARAMAESWGKIDEIEFEERWKVYVMEDLK
jgi:hypothetical protein